ncbi:hypothetical protein PPROV_001013800 [Pycnococcus provasolii]|uniref:Auxin efflux carrier component n=1 Tax=Pycnococcus provasolii TaxID=41880 RepID=A0A830I021_9CHLO|nr:hypothetical protein PPROV_001013800 [Pycnococcus provasolii]
MGKTRAALLALPPAASTVAAAWAKLVSVCALGLVGVPASSRAATAKGVSNAAFNVMFPALLFTSTAAVVRAQPAEALATCIIGAGVQITASAAFGYCVAKVLNLEGRTFRETVVASAFGNATTIPLLLLSGIASAGILPPDVDATTLTGFLSIYQVGWSVCLWTVAAAYLQGENSDTSFTGVCKRLATPPSMASLTGLAVGFTPAPVYNLLTGHLDASEGVLMSTVSHAWADALGFLGTGAQPALAMVLALSLAGGGTASAEDGDVDGDDDDDDDAIVPDVLARQLVGTLIVRCLCLPVFTGIVDSVHGASSTFGTADAAVRAVLVLEGCQPTAQVLVLLSQVQGTRSDATRIARLLLLQYVLAIPAMVAWVGYLL